MLGCKDPALYAGLYRPCTILRVVHSIDYKQGFEGLALYAGLS